MEHAIAKGILRSAEIERSIVATIAMVRFQMNVSKHILRAVAVLLIAVLLSPAKQRDWKQGHLVSVDVMTIPITKNKVSHRYQCVVSDGAYYYTIEFKDPLKTAVHDPIKLVIEKDSLRLVDADGKERSSRIEKRERALLDSDR